MMAVGRNQGPRYGLAGDPGRQVASEAVRGVSRNDEPNGVRASDVRHIGSDGKAMTVMLFARLVDAGQLSWSTPLERMAASCGSRS